MNNYEKVGNLRVDKNLLALINNEIIPGAGIEKEHFWNSFEHIIDELAPINKKLLQEREDLQEKIDTWHKNNKYDENNLYPYKTFLQEIGYLLEEGKAFKISTQDVDTEICEQAGPQLVVPANNARFALNAANARWGSLYDALYGTDVISLTGDTAMTKEFNPLRAKAVVAFAKKYLDTIAPLQQGSHLDVTNYKILDDSLMITLEDNSVTKLKEENKFIGYQGTKTAPVAILLKNNNLHVEIQIDKEDKIAKEDKASVKDIFVEAAVTTIIDCEDSVTAVDAQDKVEVYKNWSGLIKGDLQEQFLKNGKMVTRKLNQDRTYNTVDGRKMVLPGRSLLFVRNVGHLMTTSAILDKENNEIPEGIMDAMITVLASIPDLNKTNLLTNSRTKSIYIVKPKMHGPKEVSFSVKTFEEIEKALNLKKNTIKIGIMDEERRTTLNLKECIRAASERVVFINTGFLDRTGDEIHTSMGAGPFLPKLEIKKQPWIQAYEERNVEIGLECGLQGKAQIGKGMWAMPDEMAAMLRQKIAHPKAGASTAWVPSPTSAVLHSIHYHLIDVKAEQEVIKKRSKTGLDNLLKIPLLDDRTILTSEQITHELNNNAQSLLGYVVRWIDEGIGCSKVPDIDNIELMEDRATLRISSQHMANWLEHGICSKEEILNVLKKMAIVVDKQNKDNFGYKNMAPTFDGIAFKAACSLVFEGKTQPSGYTEPLLHKYRLQCKERFL